MKKPVILLVDDTQLFIDVETGFLKQTQATVHTAENGVQALEKIKEERPDLIYMDLHMPEMDGAGCCSILKGDAELRSIPIIMLIAAGKEYDRIACQNAGADGILTKPVERREFLEFGRRFLPVIDRRELRIPCRTLVVLRTRQNTWYGTSEDVSANGIYISTKQIPMQGDTVELNFTFPGWHNRLVELAGKVAWINSEDNRFKPKLPLGFGVEFKKIGSEARTIISEYIDSYGKPEMEFIKTA